ncbi:MAG: MotA/TolQ/ExbB proton channel family protein [Shinella sp.]
MRATETQPDADTGRLRAYLLCLTVMFALYCAIHAYGQGFRVFAFCALTLAALVASVLLPATNKRFQLLVRLTATTAGATATLVPLMGEVLAGKPLAVAVQAEPVWPQILVALFAARVLSEACDLRFSALWRDPLGSSIASTQSMSAAILLGCCLTLVFYQFTGSISIAPDRLDPLAIVIRAFTGATIIHAAIILLFFVVAAATLDAALLARQDSMALASLRALCRRHLAEAGGLTKAQLGHLAGTALPQYAHTRSLNLVCEAVRNRDHPIARRSLEAFHAASRHLVRALLAFIPLLGFLGTVIGLTAAVGGLPNELNAPGSGNLDIGASLLGLAVKFETTLLGLTGALIASLLLAFLEKREGEIAAECLHLVETLPDE